MFSYSNTSTLLPTTLPRFYFFCSLDPRSIEGRVLEKDWAVPEGPLWRRLQLYQLGVGRLKVGSGKRLLWSLELELLPSSFFFKKTTKKKLELLLVEKNLMAVNCLNLRLQYSSNLTNYHLVFTYNSQRHKMSKGWLDEPIDVNV